jgi:hypothetical protein
VQTGEVGEHGRAEELVVELEVARQVADPAAGGEAVARGVVAEHLGAAGGGHPLEAIRLRLPADARSAVDSPRRGWESGACSTPT